MIEYDLESYRRKFYQTKAVFFLRSDKTHYQDYVREISTDGDSVVVFRGNKFSDWMTVQGEKRQAEFIYSPIETGVMLYEGDNTKFFVVSRQQSKSFQVGLGNAFKLQCFSTKLKDQVEPIIQQVDLLSTVPERIYIKSDFGYLNRFFWWCADQLFWKDTLVGFIENPHVVHITRPEFAHSVRRAWKNPCQTPVLLTSSE